MLELFTIETIFWCLFWAILIGGPVGAVFAIAAYCWGLVLAELSASW